MRDQEHDRYSELLKPYLEGQLEREEARLLQEHLSGCMDCAAEASALRALLEEPGPGLSDLERARLHRAIETARNEAPVSAWRTKLVPALSAAALLAIVAVGLTTIDFGGADEDASGTATEAVQDEDSALDMQAGAAPAQESLPYATTFESLGKVSERRLSSLGAAGFSSGADLFADSRTAATPEAIANDAPAGGGNEEGDQGGDTVAMAKGKEVLDRDAVRAAQVPTLTALVSQAPDPELGEQIRECALQVLDSNPYLMIPVFASTARLDRSPVLVIGFRWREEGRGELNRYQVWAWPRGSCDVSVYYAAGRIR